MKRINIHQWLAMSSLLLLGPMLRLLPRLSAAQAGRASWLSAPIALPLLLGYALFLSRFWAGQPEGLGLGELTLRLLGPRAGKAALFGFALWLLFYGGFILRSGADRMVVSIYPRASPAVFTGSMALLCLFAALGSLRSLGRTAKLLLPVAAALLLLMLLLSLKGLERGNLLPVTVLELPAMLRGSVPVLDVLGLGLFLPQFFLGYLDRRGPLLPRYARWLLLQTALCCLLMLSVVGNFGAELVSQLTQPFFTLVRNLVLFHSLERIEALVVSCWVFPDFLLVSLCLFAAQSCLRLALGDQPQRDRACRLELGGRRGLIPLCALVCLLFGLLLAPDLLALRRLSDRIVPALNLCVSYLSLPLLLAGEKLRRRLAGRSLRTLLRRRKAAPG